MADRYQDRSFPSDGFGRGGDPRADADPLAELARLIGQTDAQSGRGVPPVAPRGPAARQPAALAEPEPSIPPGPPSWMQRANRQEIPKGQQQVPASARDPFAEMPREPQRAAAAPGFAAPPPFPGAVQGHSDLNRDFAAQDFDLQQAPHPAAAPRSHPNQDFADELAKLDFSVGESRHRFGAEDAEVDPHFQREPAFDEQGADPSRYDEALYGQLGPAQQDYQGEQDYQEDQFGYQDGYDEAEEEEAPKRRGGKVMVVAVLALGVLGTSGAFAYRTYFAGGRSGEPPIIKADNSPTKIMASPADTSPKVPDRLLGGDGGEKLVSREEAPVDPSRSIGGNGGNNGGGPRVVFPQPPNSSPPSTASVAPTAMASAAPSVNNGTMPNGDPRPIKTLSVSGNQADAAAAPPPAPKPAKVIAAQPVLPHNSPANANASAAPMAITPQQAPAAGRVASLNPTDQPAAAAPAASGGGGYLVSISSQISEADAISSYQAVQAKYSSVLGSYSPVIKRVEPNGKVMYRAAVGPFATRDEANKMCGTLKSAGGQCFAFSNQ